MPRLRGIGIVTKHQEDVHERIEYLDDEVTFNRVNTSDRSLAIVDVASSRPDVTISFSVQYNHVLTVTGPWLVVGRQLVTFIAEMLKIANDALVEGRQADALSVIAQAVGGPHPIHPGASQALNTETPGISARPDLRIMIPIMVGTRMEWSMRVSRNKGAPPGPVDIWLRTIVSREVQ